MNDFKLNIYSKEKDNKGNVLIEKTYHENPQNILFGVLEDFLVLYEETDEEVAMLKQIRIAKPFLKSLFVDITDDEIKRTKPDEVFSLMTIVMTYAITQVGETSKNV